MAAESFGIVRGHERLIGVDHPRGSRKFEWSRHGFPLFGSRTDVDRWLSCIRGFDPKPEAAIVPAAWLHCCECDVCSGRLVRKAVRPAP